MPSALSIDPACKSKLPRTPRLTIFARAVPFAAWVSTEPDCIVRLVTVLNGVVETVTGHTARTVQHGAGLHRQARDRVERRRRDGHGGTRLQGHRGDREGAGRGEHRRGV